MSTKKSNKHKVYETYDQIIDWFDAHRSKELTMESFYLAFIQEHIPANGSILDIGCGTGEPLARFFIEQGYQLTGVDASQNMIELCKKRFPDEKWILSDMRQIHLKQQFDLVIAWHSLFHLPHQDQRDALKLMAAHVKENGLLVFTSGPEYGEVWSDNGGYDLYHASLSIEEYKQILKKNHLDVLVLKVEDPNCGEATVWVAQNR